MAAKAKKKVKSRTTSCTADLVAIAVQVNLQDGFFDGDVQDWTDGEAKDKARKINEGGLEDQLDYLQDCGFSIKRLEELIHEGAMTPRSVEE